MNIDQQLDALISALGDVVDLDRGLADAVLPRAHAELVAGLDDGVDLDAGLARVVPPAPGPRPQSLDGFVAFADELSKLPAAERLAARAWLEMDLLVEARTLAAHLPDVRALRDALDDSPDFETVRAALLVDAVRVADGLESSEFLDIARRLVRVLRRESAEAAYWTRLYTQLLDDSCTTRLYTALRKVSITIGAGARLHFDAASCAATLAELLDRMLSALNGMVGADLASVSLDGVPLDGVRWSSDTRWPPGWEAWVRDHSVPVAGGVFEIRPGKAGNRVPT